MNCDVTKIIRRITEKGDTEAYGELVKKYSDAAFAVALSILGNREDARDMTQDAFVMAYEMLPDLRDPGKFTCWLKRIVSGLSKNFLRDRQRRVAAHTAAVQHAAEVVQGPLVHAAEREEDAVVYRQVQALPERHRTVIIMKYLEGMRYDDIASFLDISVRSVKVLSMEAKRLLLVRLKKQGIAAPELLRVRTA
jgi:RNA polymerase sigma-70 factor (ECF subfamily)